MFYVVMGAVVVVCIVAMTKASPPVWCTLLLVLLWAEMSICGRLIIKPLIQRTAERKIEQRLRVMYGSDRYDRVFAEGVAAGDWDEDGNAN